jgi:hypothetical protein
VIREDRELLALLARLNTDMVSLAMRIMEHLMNGPLTLPELTVEPYREP